MLERGSLGTMKKTNAVEGWQTTPRGILVRGGRWYIGQYPTGWYLWTRDNRGWGPFDSVTVALRKRRMLIRKWKAEGTYDEWIARINKLKARDRRIHKANRKKRRKGKRT